MILTRKRLSTHLSGRLGPFDSARPDGKKYHSTIFFDKQ